MKKSKKIAITGGIGSGKSTVLQMLKQKGYNTVSLDAVYNELLQDENYVLQISKQFEISPLEINGKYILDKQALSQKVFNNTELLKELNAFTHKSIFKKAFEKQNQGVTFYEVPLLFEGEYQNLFDSVWVVMRSYEKRIVSACERDNVTREKIENKAKNQIDYDKINLSLHTILQNDGNKAELEKCVERALNEII